MNTRESILLIICDYSMALQNCHSLYMGFLVYYFPDQLALGFVHVLSRIPRPIEWYELFLST